MAEPDFYKKYPEIDDIYYGVTLREIEEEWLVNKIKTDNWSYNFWYGVVSKFPLCCIFYFNDVCHENLYNKLESNELTSKIEENKRKMCPLCVENELRNINIRRAL